MPDVKINYIKVGGGSDMVRCAAQIGPDYLGTEEAARGFVVTLPAASDFLVSQGGLPEAPSHETFETFLVSDWRQSVVEMQ
ncbi:MAG: hypothetical protein AAGA38_00600 [Pseudomonadota bacterium]